MRTLREVKALAVLRRPRRRRGGGGTNDFCKWAAAATADRIGSRIYPRKEWVHPSCVPKPNCENGRGTETRARTQDPTRGEQRKNGDSTKQRQSLLMNLD